MANTPSIAFIGGGNMARSIIGGLVANGFSGSDISVSDPYQSGLDALATDFSVATTSDNQMAIEGKSVVVLAVKPQALKSVCQDLDIGKDTLVISIAAGITIDSMTQWLGGNAAIVRCMPNTPSLIQTGASGLYANSEVTEDQKQLADTILSAVGITTWLDSEAQIDPVTAVSGSGPAYFFLMMEAMIDAGVAQGLSVEAASQLTIQTALGAAKLAQSSDVDVAELRRRVTSPNGTTEQAILTFEKEGLRSVVDKAMVACRDRSIELATELGEN